MTERNNDAGARRPDYIAYQVTQTQEGKGIFNRIGAAWEHRDRQGFQLQLDSLPVNGQVSLRALREDRMQGYEQQRQAHETQPQRTAETPERTRSRGR